MAGQSWGLLCAWSIQRAAACSEGHRQSGDSRDDTGELPAAENSIANARVEDLMSAPEGQFIGEGLFVVELAIEVGWGIVPAPVDEEDEAAVVVAVVVQALAPGKCRGEGQAMRKALGEACLQGLVVGRESEEILVCGSGPAEGQIAVCIMVFRIGTVAAAIVAGQVDVLRTRDIRAVICDIGQLQREVAAKSLLDGDSSRNPRRDSCSSAECRCRPGRSAAWPERLDGRVRQDDDSVGRES